MELLFFLKTKYIIYYIFFFTISVSYTTTIIYITIWILKIINPFKKKEKHKVFYKEFNKNKINNQNQDIKKKQSIYKKIKIYIIYFLNPFTSLEDIEKKYN